MERITFIFLRNIVTLFYFLFFTINIALALYLTMHLCIIFLSGIF